jgi:hypothetical protein
MILLMLIVCTCNCAVVICKLLLIICKLMLLNAYPYFCLRARPTAANCQTRFQFGSWRQLASSPTPKMTANKI